MIHDIAPPRIPSDSASDPVCFAGSQKEITDFPPRPAWIPSDPVRIQSQKMHQIQAKSITHDIAPPRIPSDPARIPSDPVA